MGYDTRIGFQFLHPGPGLRRFVLPEGRRRAAAHLARGRVRLRAARRRRRRQPRRSTSASSTRSATRSAASLAGTVIAVVGPHVQGRHRRPARLAGARDRARACSRKARSCGRTIPRRGERPRQLVPGIELCADAYEAAAGADVVALLTEWDEFRWLDFERVRDGDARRARSSTPATCSTRPRCAAAASTTTASGGGRWRASSSPAAPGFVGSHLCDALLARGDEVVAVDNLVHGPVENVAAPRRTARASPSCAPTCRDEIPVDGPGRRRAALREPGEPARVPRDPARDARRRLARHAARARPRARERRAVPRSRRRARSTAIPHVHPQPEIYNGNVDPIGPRAVYDEAKRFAETLTDDVPPAVRPADRDRAHLQHVRPAPAPGRRARRVELPGAGASTASRSTVYGTGSQTRSFCYVDDEVRGILALFDSDVVRAGEHRQPQRVHDARAGRPRPRGHRLELRDRVRAACRSAIPPAASPTSRARATLLGWEPTVELRDGLARMRDWYLEERARGRA